MRVLRLLTRPNLGGPMRQAVALWHAQRELGVRTLIAVGNCASHELEFVGDLPVAPASIDSASEGLLTLPTLCPGITPIRDHRSRRHIRTLIRSFQPDVVHTHTSKAGWLARGLARRLRVPLVAHTYHGLVLRDYFPAPMSWALRHVERRMGRLTNLNLSVSETCAQELATFGIPGVRVVPPAVDTADAGADPEARAEAKALLGLGEGSSTDFVVGFVGRLVPIKRIELFLRMLDLLPDGTRAIVVGDGPMGSVVQHAVQTRPGLRWFGADPRAPALIRGLDALVIPSRREGFPLVAVEAAAADVPCVGFAVPGVLDALSATGGHLVPESEGAEGLAAAVMAIRARDLGAAKRQHSRQACASLVARCDPARVGEQLLDLYRELISNHG